MFDFARSSWSSALLSPKRRSTYAFPVFAGLLVGFVALWPGEIHSQDVDAKRANSQSARENKPTAEQLEFFEKKIRPVLVENCFACHSATADELSGALSLEGPEGWSKGGYSGPAVTPGDVDASLLIQAIRYTGDFSDMPPDGKLSDEVIKDFEDWVRMGAPAPEAQPTLSGSAASSLPPPDRNHWSLVALAPATVPEVAESDWPLDELDHYIFRRLQDNELSPSADADDAVWLRRVYLDLVGLPPSPAVLKSFLQNPSRDNRERFVDQLLASKAFGERWGRHWLDVVRYADSTGGGRTRLMPQAWRFRDYVIQAFHEDRPIDELIVQHIAGDLIETNNKREHRENTIASGFLALGPYNYEKQDKDQLRMDVVDEQLDTIGKAFLGLTLGCARCHDHKFDPITSADYYAMAGVLRNTQTLITANVSNWVEVDLGYTPEQQAAANEIKTAISKLDEEVKQLQRETAEAALTLGLHGYAPDGSRLGGILLDDALAKKTGDWENSTSVKPFIGAGYIHDKNDGKGKKSVQFEAELPQSGNFEVRLAYTHGDNRAQAAQIEVYAKDGKQTVALDQRVPPGLDGKFQSLGVFEFGRSAKIIVSNAKSTGHVIVDAIQLVAQEDADAGEAVDPTADRAATSHAGADDPEIEGLLKQSRETAERIAKMRTERESLNKRMPAASRAMSVREEKQIEDGHVLVGGDVHRPAEPVHRGAPSWLGEEAEPIPEESSGRLELAHWIASNENPLTARVYVNRVWSHLFGQGIVTSCDNFGAMGTDPSHPELLDFLAAEFIDSGWSTKQLVRRIVLSRTYSQGYAENAAAEMIDPQNRLLWRANRRRLDAEVLRDVILAVAGQLEDHAGGPAFPAKHANEFTPLEEKPIRSVYLPVFRNHLHPLFAAFDFGNPSFVSGRREMSTRPAQALFFMNSDFLELQTQATGAWLANLQADDLERMEALYQRALSRSPTERESEFLLGHLEQNRDQTQAPQAAQDSWADIARAVFSSVDFRYVE